MSKIEEVKKIARSMITASHYNNLDDKTFDNYIKEIYQLFPRSPDNPDGYEAKPDESRLLTGEKRSEVIQKDTNLWCPTKGKFLDEVGEVMAKAQDAKTAPIEYKRGYDDACKVKDAEFLEWLREHGNQQQVKLFKEERFKETEDK